MVTKSLFEWNEYKVEVSRKKMRHLRLYWDSFSSQLKVSAPKRVSYTEIFSFMEKNKNWIEEQVKKAPFQRYLNGETVLLFGESIELFFYPSKQSFFKREKEALLIYGTEALINNPVGRKKLLDKFYLYQMKIIASEKVRAWSLIMGVQVNVLRFRKMKTRWGSCFPQRGQICLNSDLMRYPLSCLDYVIVHECAHFFEPGHGVAFKKILDQFYPEWKRDQKILQNRM